MKNTALGPNKRKGIVSIDFWFTMVDGRVGGEKRNALRLQALHQLAKKNDTKIDESRVKEAYKVATAEFERIWLNEQRTMATVDLVGLVLQHLGLQASKEEQQAVAKVYAESLWEGQPALAPGLKEALAELAEHYDLGLISDTMYSPGSVLKVYLERQGVLKYFNAFVFSDEVGYSKPDIRAFEAIRQQLGSPSEEAAFHIGDLVKTDIKGAKASGYTAIQYTGLNKDEPTGQADYLLHNWHNIKDILTANA